MQPGVHREHEGARARATQAPLELTREDDLVRVRVRVRARARAKVRFRLRVRASLLQL